MSSSQHPTSSQSIHIHRIVALCAIVFFVGLQIKDHRLLFESSIDDANLDAAWAPDDFGEAKPKPKLTSTQRRRQRKRKITKVEKSRREKDNNDKKKKKKKSQRFMAANYTSDWDPLPWTLPKPTPIRYQTSEEFMAGYIAEKRKHNIPLPWEQHNKYANLPVTLPLPIISVNFPKSATLTMKTYFDCGGITSIHTSTQDGRIAVCLMENQLADRPPMDGCNTHKVRNRKGGHRHEVLPIDFISDIGLQGPPCYYPAVHDGGLENIVKHYPNATVLLVTRDAAKWYRSIAKWGSLVIRLKKYCGFSGSVEHSGKHHNVHNTRYWNEMYESNSREEFWVNFYQSHTQKIREFVMRHLSLTYIEVELENPQMAEILEKYTRVPKSCVMDCHPGPKWVRENNATNRCHPVGENPAHKNAKAFVDVEEDSENEQEEEPDNGEVEEEDEGNDEEDGEEDEDNDEEGEEDDDEEEDEEEHSVGGDGEAGAENEEE